MEYDDKVKEFLDWLADYKVGKEPKLSEPRHKYLISLADDPKGAEEMYRAALKFDDGNRENFVSLEDFVKLEKVLDTFRTKKLKRALKFEKFYDLEDSLKELIEKDCPGGYDLVDKYITTANKYGYNSIKTSEMYDSIVKKKQTPKSLAGYIS
jgi:predicted transcriptional regulator